jgi:hypothetical protein
MIMISAFGRTRAGWFQKVLCRTVLTAAAVLSVNVGLCSSATESAVLWNESFEQLDFWGRWHSEGSIWTVGAPTSGPGAAYAGVNCASTLMDGDYPSWADALLVRDRVFIVPDASMNPRLRFWEWFKAGPGATRAVEIRAGTGAWEALSGSHAAAEAAWSRAWFDLSRYSGQPVRIAFRFRANGNVAVAPGWYLDEVQVETGPVVAPVQLRLARLSPESVSISVEGGAETASYFLEMAEDLESGDWMPFDGTWVDGTTVISTTRNARFYRVRSVQQ